ncbi:MAG: RimK family alpha-L-glutamate ligase [Candidatus Aenigmatarchaeota archaeon]
MANIAVIWDAEVDDEGEEPFNKKYMNDTYEYFSDLAAEKDAEVYIATFSWFDKGILEKAYRWNGEEWVLEQNIEVEVVFDKYRFDEETQEMKKWIENNMPVLNHFRLEEICKDKLLTYQTFPGRVAETREATKENVEEFLEKDGRTVLKPRFDFGGTGVRVIGSIEEFEEEQNLLVQRFIDSTSGIEELGVEGVHDLRVVVVSGEPVLSYVRTPDEGFISNVSLGGRIEFVDLEDVQEEAMEIVEEVKEKFSGFKPYVFGVDMIFDESQEPWILELNSKPGLAIYDEEVKKRKKKYIGKVVETLVEMV